MESQRQLWLIMLLYLPARKLQQFTDRNGIKHLTMAPYHPALNELAEWAVQTLKTGLKKMTISNIEDKLASFLFQYRIMPHTTAGRAQPNY